MGSHQVPWLLVLTFSLCWGCQVETVHESDTSRIIHHDDASFKKAITVAPYNPLVLSSHKILERAQHSSTSNHNTENRVSEIKLLHSAAAAAGSEDENARQRGRRKQEKHVRILKLQKTREVLVSTADEASSLGQMLVTVVMAELRECALVVAYDAGYSRHPVLQHLLLLHNPRQVVYINTTEDLTRIIWTSSMCRGYFFLLDDPEPLLTFVKDNQDTWDYGGRHILVVPSLKYLEAFTDTLIGKKTEHIVGVVKLS
ncbi:uncharacterized protein [Panulirus ornatus]|uniref:uncharacterized protein n=1 Tax=Panulirus ornatus TaxID=150431 RepID=UPI003A8C1B0E